MASWLDCCGPCSPMFCSRCVGVEVWGCEGVVGWEASVGCACLSILFLFPLLFLFHFRSLSPACDWSVCSEFGECVCTIPSRRMEAWEEDWIWSDLHPRLGYLPSSAPDQHGQWVCVCGGVGGYVCAKVVVLSSYLPLLLSFLFLLHLSPYPRHWRCQPAWNGVLSCSECSQLCRGRPSLPQTLQWTAAVRNVFLTGSAVPLLPPLRLHSANGMWCNSVRRSEHIWSYLPTVQ